MTLAPIRGAPPGAPIPAFPTEDQRAKSAPPTATSATGDQPQAPLKRQRGTPIGIDGNGNTLAFRVIPEIPAIKRASMTVHVVAVEQSSHTLGFLQMSAANARRFLTDLRNGRSPIVATGDEDGTVQIKFEATESGPIFSVHQPGERCALRRWIIDPTFDIKFVADELLADLGA